MSLLCQGRNEWGVWGCDTLPDLGDSSVNLKICKEKPSVKQGKRCLVGIFIKTGSEIDKKNFICW
jgi:hypothetical protein